MGEGEVRCALMGGLGRLWAGSLAEGVLCHCLGERIWLSLAGVTLEKRIKMKEVVTSQVGDGCRAWFGFSDCSLELAVDFLRV